MKFYNTETDNLTRRQINALFRKHDDSHLWPICGKFNATERAIRHARKFERDGGEIDDYASFIDLELSIIVNSET